ncbi:hypothetical protein RSW36_25120 [Escherichia coli]|uniref:hypothetical protein n=1 Tax=Escherichia coli TaxID=562 RepID=UPI0028DD5318|nr:hypothetical protein [Escherichia coli]MDT9046434.1 hypothetical protein [Escherichia coli]
MSNEITQADALVSTFTTGDARRMIMQTIMDLRSGSMPTDRGLAIAANMKVLNDSMTAEVNAAKLAIQASEKGQDFGKLVQMGQRKIAA